jgi:hypothetical protein
MFFIPLFFIPPSIASFFIAQFGPSPCPSNIYHPPPPTVRMSITQGGRYIEGGGGVVTCRGEVYEKLYIF